MIKVFIDTNILVDYSKGRSDLLTHLLKAQSEKFAELCVNAVVIAEFVTGVDTESKKKEEETQEFLKKFTGINIDDKEGFLAGKLRREKKTEYLGDALIAATCLIHDIQLLTRNIKHFQKIKGLQFYSSSPLMKYYGAFPSKKKLDMENLRDYIDYSDL